MDFPAENLFQSKETDPDGAEGSEELTEIASEAISWEITRTQHAPGHANRNKNGFSFQNKARYESGDAGGNTVLDIRKSSCNWNLCEHVVLR